MNRTWLIVIGVLLIIFTSILIYSNSASEENIVGEYVELGEGRLFNDNIKDTLKLYSDGNYTSKEWGIGKYTIEHGIFKTSISLAPNDKQIMGLKTEVTGGITNPITIWLDYDLLWRFEKYK